MKVQHANQSKFRPITITIDSFDELQAIKCALGFSGGVSKSWRLTCEELRLALIATDGGVD